MTGDMWLHITTFLLWTGSVAIITYFVVTYGMKKTEDASDDYFAGGNSLKWYVVAGSLMLTNLSSEQLVGLNGAIFQDGCLAGVWWEAGAALAMLFTALVFLPQYVQQGVITTSGFLGERYDRPVRTLVATIFLVYYALILCPLVLYTGALAIINIFELDMELWIVSTVIGTLGAIYAISGGLKAVAVSDCLNGIGLAIAGLWVPIAALRYLSDHQNELGGNGTDASEPWTLFSEPDKLRVIVSESMVYNSTTQTRQLGVPSIPWHVTIVGMSLNNLYYWATNQMIMQRVLGAESLAQGQKGVLFAASMKVMGFAFLCLPGLIAILLQDAEVPDRQGNPFVILHPDTVYPRLVRLVMPTWAQGFFVGVLLGSVLSTFNSALNSAATMFSLEIYQIYVNPDVGQDALVRVANIFGVFLTLGSFIVAPQLEGVGGIFNFLQNVNTIIALPILSIFFVGIFTDVVDTLGAKTGFAVGLVAVLAGQAFTDFIDFGQPMYDSVHYLHVYSIAFGIAMVSIIMATTVGGYRKLFGYDEKIVRFRPQNRCKVDNTPWSLRFVASVCIVLVLVCLFTALQTASPWLFYGYIFLWIGWFVLLIVFPVPEAVPPEDQDGEKELSANMS